MLFKILAEQKLIEDIKTILEDESISNNLKKSNLVKLLGMAITSGNIELVRFVLKTGKIEEEKLKGAFKLSLGLLPFHADKQIGYDKDNIQYKIVTLIKEMAHFDNKIIRDIFYDIMWRPEAGDPVLNAIPWLIAHGKLTQDEIFRSLRSALTIQDPFEELDRKTDGGYSVLQRFKQVPGLCQHLIDAARMTAFNHGRPFWKPIPALVRCLLKMGDANYTQSAKLAALLEKECYTPQEMAYAIRAALAVDANGTSHNRNQCEQLVKFLTKSFDPNFMRSVLEDGWGRALRSNMGLMDAFFNNRVQNNDQEMIKWMVEQHSEDALSLNLIKEEVLKKKEKALDNYNKLKCIDDIEDIKDQKEIAAQQQKQNASSAQNTHHIDSDEPEQIDTTKNNIVLKNLNNQDF
jgi:hypothetical protein